MNCTFGNTKITVEPRNILKLDSSNGTVTFDCENGENSFPIPVTKKGEEYISLAKPMANGKVEDPDKLIEFLKEKAKYILENTEPNQ